MDYHYLLQKQMEECLSSAVLSEEVQAFIQNVNMAYKEYERCQLTLEQSLDKTRHSLAVLKKTSETTLAALTKTAMDAIVMIDQDCKIYFWNFAAEKMFGYKKEEVLGKAFIEVLIPEIMHIKYKKMLKDFQEKGISKLMGRVFEQRLSCKNGQELIVEISATSFLVDDKYHASWIIHDISSRKQAEMIVRENETRLKTILDAVQVGVVLIDVETKKIVDVNPVALKLLGKKRADVLGHICHNFICPAEEGNCPVIDLKQKVDRSERVLLGSGGRKIPILKNVVVIEINGKPHLLESFVDLTVQKRAQRELERAILLAEEGNKSKSEFLANMSHEIRTPMNPIVGMTELLLTTNLTSEQRDMIMTIKDAASSLLVVINDILDYSKIEAGKLTLEEVGFSLREVVERAVELLALRAREKALTLMTYIEPKMQDAFCGDPIRLRQVILNLVGNAVKFTEIGEVIVQVSLIEEGEGFSLVKFEVIDTGTGLSEIVKKRLFSPFVQADGSTTRKFGGTGLGLAICKRIVAIMDGEIGVESVEGEGSVFWFTVPLVHDLNKEDEGGIWPDFKLENKAVLIVDDSAAVRAILGSYLEAYNMKVVLADSGKEGFDKLQQSLEEGKIFDLVLIDLVMAGVDGIALAKTIRSNQDYDQCKMIAMTAFDRPKLKEEIEKLGFVDLLLKPIRQSQLFDCLANVLLKKKKITALEQKKMIEIIDKAVKTEEAVKEKISSVRILLVEDNPANQKLALMLLKKMGYVVEMAKDGLNAVEMFMERQKEGLGYAAILMDCQMPVMDGFEATGEIRVREKQWQGHVPIIAMTANAMTGDREKCLDVGMDDYVTKPIDVKRLKLTLEKWVLDN